MEKIKKYFKWFFDSFIWLGLLLLVADLVSKLAVIANKDAIRAEGGVVLIPNFLRINYTINNKMVMGLNLGSDLTNRIVFCVFASIITVALIVFTVLKWGKINKYYRACIMMVLSGALGNLVDRIFYTPEYLSYTIGGVKYAYNGVVDWIDFYGIWGFNFNIADSAVVVAAFMLIIYMIVTEIVSYVKANKDKPKEVDNEKVLSKTEQEKQKYLEKKDNE